MKPNILNLINPLTPYGGFHCFHAHCKDRNLKDLKEFLGIQGKEVVSLKEIYHKGPTEIRHAKKACGTMIILEEHGWVTRLTNALIDEKPCKEAWCITYAG
jgi:hypothetical protein